jgi:hypothetical protein
MRMKLTRHDPTASIESNQIWSMFDSYELAQGRI